MDSLFLLAAAIALVVGCFVGWALACGSAHRWAEEAEALRQRERAEAERAMARLHRELEEAQGKAKDLTEVFQILPDLVRQMFSSRGRRGVGAVTLKLLDQLFRPDQAATFVVRQPPSEGLPDDDLLSRTGKRLMLVAGRGLPASLGPASRWTSAKATWATSPSTRCPWTAATSTACLAPPSRRCGHT